MIVYFPVQCHYTKSSKSNFLVRKEKMYRQFVIIIPFW